MRKLNAKGNIKVTDFTFEPKEQIHRIGEALNKTIAKAAQKVPALRGKKVTIPHTRFEYELLSTDYLIKDGQLDFPHFQTQAKPNAGMDVKGNATVDLMTGKLSASGEMTDTYDLTRAPSRHVGNHVLAVVCGIPARYIFDLRRANSRLEFLKPILISPTACCP